MCRLPHKMTNARDNVSVMNDFGFEMSADWREREDWRARLLAAIDADGRSDRAISLAAGLSPNFVHQMRGGIEPGVKKVLRLAAEVKISLAELFYGRDFTHEDEQFLALLQSASEEERRSLLALLRARRSSET